MQTYLEIGKIVSTHGLNGEFNVDLWCDDAAFVKQFKTLYLGADKQPFSVRSAKAKGNQSAVKLNGIDTVEEARRLVGQILYFNRQDVKLPDGIYFESDLIGLNVIDVETGEAYGVLSAVYRTGANDVYGFKNKSGKEILIPAIKSIVDSVSLDEGVIKIRPMDGLFDEN